MLLMRQLTGFLRAAVTAWLAGAAALHLYWGGTGFPEPIFLRGLHLLLFVPPIFLLWPANANSVRHQPSIADWVWCVAAAAPHAWVMWNAGAVSDRVEFVDPFSPLMAALAVLAVVTLLEATRRAVEIGLAWMVITSLAYMQFGHLLPGVLNTRPFSPAEILEASWLVPTVGGVYGPLTGIVATTIAVFIVFGAFMQGSGTGRLFSNLGAASAGRFSGGPAKVAVISSGLFGTMSGSSVANVITTGAMTIPLMKHIGYPAAVAGGIEAAASVGGALMPPVMGAAAFVMAEITAIPYSDIVITATVGAVLYYFAILAAVHFEAQRLGIAAMAREEIPSWREVLADAHLALPIALLVWMMVERWSGNFAAFCATLAMIAVSFLRARTRMSPATVLDSLFNAGLTLAPLAVAIAGAGIVVSALTTTGMVVAFGGIIKHLAGDSLPLLLVLLGATVLVLGMGLPTTPSYIIAAAIGVPQLVAMGVELLPAHLFLFYFAVLADATPPVAAAAFAAASVARAPPTLTSLHATRFGIAGFTVGFGLIYDPGLMLQGPLSGIVTAIVIQLLALTAITAAWAGHLLAPMTALQRGLLGTTGLAAAFLHVVPDLARLGLVAITLCGVALVQRRRPVATGHIT